MSDKKSFTWFLPAILIISLSAVALYLFHIGKDEIVDVYTNPPQPQKDRVRYIPLHIFPVSLKWSDINLSHSQMIEGSKCLSSELTDGNWKLSQLLPLLASSPQLISVFAQGKRLSMKDDNTAIVSQNGTNKKEVPPDQLKKSLLKSLSSASSLRLKLERLDVHITNGQIEQIRGPEPLSCLNEEGTLRCTCSY